MGFKSMIYKLLRISNDINAVRRGRFSQRMGRRATRKITNKGINKLFKNK